MSDWIHCNKCILRFRPNIKFYVTTCGHLKCQLCVSKMDPENRCLVCNSVCKMAVLSSNLQPDVMSFFQPAVDAIDKADQVCEFQLANALSLLRAMTAKYNTAKAEMARTYKIIQDLKKEQHGLKILLKATGRAATATPAHDVGSTSVMSGNTTSSRCLNTTPVSNASCNSFLHSGSPNPSAMQWNQPQNAARLMMHRQYRNVIPSPSNSSYSGTQEHSSAPFNLSGSPNVHSHRLRSSRNASMGSMYNYRLGLGNKPR